MKEKEIPLPFLQRLRKTCYGLISGKLFNGTEYLEKAFLSRKGLKEEMMVCCSFANVNRFHQNVKRNFVKFKNLTFSLRKRHWQ
jgi:hypothetical protein